MSFKSLGLSVALEATALTTTAIVELEQENHQVVTIA